MSGSFPDRDAAPDRRGIGRGEELGRAAPDLLDIVEHGPEMLARQAFRFCSVTGEDGAQHVYYRAGSAASRLSAADLDVAAIAAADVLHLTGITPALGPGPLQAVERAIEIARSSHTRVSFDVNCRSKLWSAEQAGAVLARLAGSVDLLFAGPEEAALLLGWDAAAAAESFDDGEHLARGLAKLGPGTVVVKLGWSRKTC